MFEESCYDTDEFLQERSVLLFGVKSGEPEVVDSLPAVVGSLTDGADYCSKVCGVQLYESVSDVVVQISCVAFGNFY